MSSYNYIDTPNSNLVCCICRVPFTDPMSTSTCSHTFCHDCIVRALGHVAQCPVDRSPLTIHDLIPANPIVRHLVDELVVECSQRLEGCTHTCQRQLLASHLKESCQYVHVPCSEGDCDQVVLKKDVGKHAHDCVHRLTECEGCGNKVRHTDMEAHQSDCPAKTVICGFCSDEFPRSNLTKHNSACSDFVIPCTHADNGCPWAGPRHTLQSSHILSCPYESIKGFFAVNNSQISTLTDENTILKCKVEALEGAVQTMRREMQAAKTALGPWYRPEGSYPPLSRQTSSSEQSFNRPTSSDSLSTRFGTSSFMPFGSPNASTSTASNALAPYFPPEADENLPWLERHLNHTSLNGIPSTDASGHPYYGSTAHTPVAPINLSTTLEGSLDSLRESIVTLSASVDSLARRHDIELRNETLRANEEISRLNYTMNGLRMQVHNIMMDRNAQVRGRMSEPSQGWAEGEAGPSIPYGFFTPRPPSFSPATKL